jgi:hypothetical protein
VGIQIITDYLDDRTAIDIAAHLEETEVAKFIPPEAQRD